MGWCDLVGQTYIVAWNQRILPAWGVLHGMLDACASAPQTEPLHSARSWGVGRRLDCRLRQPCSSYTMTHCPAALLLVLCSPRSGDVEGSP